MVSDADRGCLSNSGTIGDHAFMQNQERTIA
jgi:hypothetical protein